MDKLINDKIEIGFIKMRKYAVILLSIIISASGQQLSNQKMKEIFEVAKLSSKGPNAAQDRKND